MLGVDIGIVCPNTFLFSYHVLRKNLPDLSLSCFLPSSETVRWQGYNLQLMTTERHTMQLTNKMLQCGPEALNIFLIRLANREILLLATE